MTLITSRDISWGFDVENLILILGCVTAHISKSFAKPIELAFWISEALEKALKVAPTEISVLVTGESGVGKESIPKITHQFSHRKHAKYIAVNCGAIPEGTIDSELFGHEKGAFTGAVDRRIGRFEQANGGTLFLDEIGDMPLECQTRLLRVLSNKEFYRVGGDKPIKVDVRILAATHQDLHSLVRLAKFREDLFYRLISTHSIEFFIR